MGSPTSIETERASRMMCLPLVSTRCEAYEGRFVTWLSGGRRAICTLILVPLALLAFALGASTDTGTGKDSQDAALYCTCHGSENWQTACPAAAGRTADDRDGSKVS